ncbi:hypothetical protein Trydic_g524 [Trypoxylus dichotomus]
MRVPVYLVCAALAVAVKSEELPSFYGRQLEPVELNSEQDAFRYIFPRLTSRFRSSRNWDDNRYYDIPSDYQINSIDEIPFSQEGRIKRANFNEKPSSAKQFRGPSLSIVNSLDVLRNRLLLEISRKKALEDANRNRNYLCQIGKRSPLFDQKRVSGL